MKKRLLLALLMVVISFSVVLSACQASGIPQSQYDQVAAQLTDSQSKFAGEQKALAELEAQKSAVDKELAAAKTTVADLQRQVSQASLVGATPAETAAKVVKNYHDTHVYSAWDYFICSDMSSEVWNMLKAQNISTVIVIGDVENPITDILQSNHAWVMATVAPGQTLALETTGGYVVKKSEHPLYYRGWSFKSPADLKANNDLRNEYNIRVAFRNQLNSEANKAISSPTLYNKLSELRTAQETELNKIMANINSLAKAVNY